MECPNCHALSFLGEWNTPKELQSCTSKKCENCKEDISAVYLIQPKEKRRGIHTVQSNYCTKDLSEQGCICIKSLLRAITSGPRLSNNEALQGRSDAPGCLNHILSAL